MQDDVYEICYDGWISGKEIEIEYTTSKKGDPKERGFEGRLIPKVLIIVSDTTFNSIKDETAIHIDSLKYKEFENWKLYEDDIILSTVGSKPPMFDSLVGKAILITKKHAGSLLNQNAVILRSKLLNQKLIYANLKRPNYIKHIEVIFRGNANQASITYKRG